MRMVQILFFIILFSCNNSATSENTKTTESSETKVSAEANKTSTQEVVVNQKISDPILGDPADIEINVRGLAEKTSYLIGFVAEGHFRVDSSQVQNEKIQFKNPKGYPQGFYYVSVGPNSYVQMILGQDQKFELSTTIGALINTMKVNGSEENKIYYENLNYESQYNSSYRGISAKLKGMDKSNSEYQELEKQKTGLEKQRMDLLNDVFRKNKDLLFTQFKRAGQNPTIRQNVSDDEKVYYYRKEFWNNVDFSDRRLIRTPVIFNKLKRYFNELTPKNPDSIFVSAKSLIDRVLEYPEYYKFFTNWIAINYEPTKTDLMDPESVFVNMIQNYFTRERAFWADSMEVYALQQRAGEMAQSLVGKKGPDVISTNEKGETKSIYEMTSDYVIVYLFNPTCEHCMKQTPLLVDWYNKNKAGNKVDVFAIAIDTNEEEWKDYIKKNNMSFTNVYDPTNRSIYAKYYVDITPELYVLNKDRTIIGKNLKVNQIDIILDRDKNN